MNDMILSLYATFNPEMQEAIQHSMLNLLQSEYLIALPFVYLLRDVKVNLTINIQK
jgi:hypothetical protein